MSGFPSAVRTSVACGYQRGHSETRIKMGHNTSAGSAERISLWAKTGAVSGRNSVGHASASFMRKSLRVGRDRSPGQRPCEGAGRRHHPR
jgi:hypothetical protein